MTGETVHAFPFHRDPAIDISAHMEYLRDHEPVARVRLPSGEQAWLVTRYDDVRMVLSDPRFSMAAAARKDAPELSQLVKMYPSLFSLDPPLHTRARKMLTRALRVRSERSLRDRVTDITSELLEEMRRRTPPIDLVDDFCEPLVTALTVYLLGTPVETIARFRTHFAAMLALAGVSKEQATEEARGMHDIITGIVRARRDRPGDDSFSCMVAEFDADGTMPEDNLIGLGANLFSAVAKSLITHLSYAIVAILRHEDQWALLRDNPGLIDSAVEECYRFSVSHEVEHLRIATEDVEVGGTMILKGSPVMTSVAAANRDPSTFPDAATFTITRTDNRHLAFGFGSHVCAGSAIGLMVLRVVLTMLVQQVPTLRLAVPASRLTLRDGQSHALSIDGVPITWSRATRPADGEAVHRQGEVTWERS